MKPERIDNSILHSIPILERVRRDYPIPFSVLASEILFEISAPNPDWSRIFSIQVDFFEGSIAFFFFVLLAELENHDEVKIKESYNNLKTFRKGKNLSTGHWWGLLRGLSSDASGLDSSSLSKMGQVARSLFIPPKGKEGRKFVDMLNDIPSIRNRFKGHTFTLTPEQYEEQAKILLIKTIQFFQKIEAIDEITLLYVTQCTAVDEERFVVDFLLLNGDMRRPLRRFRTSKKSIVKGSLWIGVEAELENELDTQGFLNLSPFVAFHPEEGSFSICQHIKKTQFERTCIIGGARNLEENSDFGLRRLDAILARVDTTNERYEEIFLRARELGEVLLKSPAATASYDAHTYLNRPRLLQQLNSVSQGNRSQSAVRIWLASAPSGSGKTALACHSIAQWLDSGRRDEVMVTALSSEIISAEGSIKVWWKQRFGINILESCSIVEKAGAIIRIFIDGVDRIVNFGVVIREISHLMKKDSVSQSLRLVISSTEAVSNQVFSIFRKEKIDLLVNRWSVPPLSPEEAKNLFTILNPEAKEVQLGKEVESLLKTPLLVRLARVLGEEEATAGITPGRLLRAHADRTVLADPIRAHLALKIVEKILEHERKSISLEELLQDDSLRSLLLTTGKNSPLQQLVQEHILLLDRAPNPNGLPLPSKAMISFAFDAQLDYLAFAQMAQKFGTDPITWCERLHGSPPFGPLIGGLRVFFVESLLDKPDQERLLELANMLYALQETGEEVLKDVLCVGLDCSPFSPIEQILSMYVEQGGVENLARLTDDAIHRLVLAGRANTVKDIMVMLRRVSPTKEFVQLCCYVINIVAWTISVKEASELAEELRKDTETMSASAQIQAWNSIRDICYLSGLQSDILRAKEIEKTIVDLFDQEDIKQPICHVIVQLLYARKANTKKDGMAREKHLDAAKESAHGDSSLLMMVALTKALLYADEGLNITDRAVRQGACHDAVQYACSIGDPFAEALACDVAAASWYMDSGVQQDWIDRGLVAASALNAKVARARLLDRRGRIYLAQGLLENALQDAQTAASIFDEVGHERHALRTKQHLLALQIHEMDSPAVAFLGWDSLIELADRLEVHFQCRLLRLLKASSCCDLGHWDTARLLIAKVKEQKKTKYLEKDVHTDMFEGEVEWGQRNQERALELWMSAYQWSIQKELHDVTFQSLLYMAWAKLQISYKTPDAVHEDEVITLVRTKVEQIDFADHLPRYLGECTLVLVLAFAQKNLIHQAKSHIEEAKNWFKKHPQHPLHGELKVLELIVKWCTFLQHDQNGNEAEQKKRFVYKNKKKIIDIQKYITRLAQSYPEENMQKDFISHHRATTMLNMYFDVSI
ncbi:MAG: hypothetical protein CL916_10410 [Deltaproteobacteria bacterium]|nr:hypothetical protein [Deltaproteobacteria bacterium]